jgi:glycine betaine/proline transport system substrate-binding protein
MGGVNHASLVGPRERLQKISSASRTVLSRISLGIDGVTEMDWMVNVQKKTARESARIWMDTNKEIVSAWFKTRK